MKTAIVGCGAIAKAHLAAVTRLGVEVVGVCDLDQERAASSARSFGVEGVYGDAAELLHRHRPDVVHIATPPQSHRDLAIQALQAGSHVLVEKPMALDVDQADEMIEQAQRSGRALGVCHNLLFDPAVLRARELAGSGRLGKVVAMEIAQTISGAERERCLTADWIQGLPGGVMHEIVPHQVYLHREFLGPLRVVSAVARTNLGRLSPSVDFRMVLESDSGLGSAALSLSVDPRQHRLRIYGSEMILDVNVRDHILVKDRRGSTGGRARRLATNLGLGLQLMGGTVTSTLAGVRKPWHRGHSGLISRFYESLRSGSALPVTAEDGRAVVSVLDQLWEAVSPPTADLAG